MLYEIRKKLRNQFEVQPAVMKRRFLDTNKFYILRQRHLVYYLEAKMAADKAASAETSRKYEGQVLQASITTERKKELEQDS